MRINNNHSCGGSEEHCCRSSSLCSGFHTQIHYCVSVRNCARNTTATHVAGWRRKMSALRHSMASQHTILLHHEARQCTVDTSHWTDSCVRMSRYFMLILLLREDHITCRSGWRCTSIRCSWVVRATPLRLDHLG